MNGNWAGVLIHGVIIYETRFDYKPPYPGAHTLGCFRLPHLANCESVCLYIISYLEFLDTTITLTVLNCSALLLEKPSNPVYEDDGGDRFRFADYNVIVATAGSPTDKQGVCNLESFCLDYGPTIDGVPTCKNWSIQTYFACWGSTENSSLTCDEPGAGWVSALVGCIIAGLSGIIFLFLAWRLKD